ncbi:hypothetical protein D3C72_603870 [compost metagenome]
MAIAMNRPVVGAQKPVARALQANAFATKSAGAKIAQGWGETIKDLPSEAVDKFKRTAHAIANPIDTAKEKIAAIKADPKKALLPLAMMAGGVALTAVSPGLMRVVGIGMTASMFVLPTIKFAKSTSEDELMSVADGTSKQLVNTAASYATSWAMGKVIRYSVQKYQERKLNVGASVQGKGDVSLQLKGDTPAEMMKQTKSVDPDAINHQGIRGIDKATGHEFVTEIRGKVKDFHFANAKKASPELTLEQFDAWLKTPEAKPVRLQMVQDVRGVVHSQALQLHGVKVPEDINVSELAGMRKHLQDITSNYDMADAVKGINTGLDKGIREAAKLNIEAERFLYTERGVTPGNFTKLEKLGVDAPGFKTTRNFADRFATSQGGKYLNVAAQKATGAEVDALRSTMTRALASDAGLIVPAGSKVDDRALLSMFRDLGDEEPANAKRLIATFNDQMKKGETNYYKMNEATNRQTLAHLGLDEAGLKALDLSDEALKAVAPDYPVELTRAEQVRLLRDRLRVLPTAQRTEAIAALKAGKADLLNFDAVLAPKLDGQIASITGANAELVAKMTKDMTAQQKANFVTDLARLPEDVRKAAFSNLQGSADEMNKLVVDRLTSHTAKSYNVNIHRDAGKFPIENWGDDELVRDWSVQGATQLHNGLYKMSTNGKIPTNLQETTYVNMIAADGSAFGKEALELKRAAGKPLLYYKPGSGAYQGGTMGYRTGTADGKDLIVLFDDAMKMANADEVAGVTLAEGTLIHESGHAIQLGGKVGTSKMEQMVTEQKLVKEWSALSDWREPDGTLADGYRMIDGDARRYYKDPAVRVGDKTTIVSDYGATDSVEDFAEFTRIFYNDPAQALAHSPEKFLYMNQMYENHYTADQTAAMAQVIGLGADGVAKALGNMRSKIAGTPGAALAAPSIIQSLRRVLGFKAA